jgi:hypothetical protein
MKLGVAIVAALLVAGNSAAAQGWADYDDAKCLRYGARRGTETYAQCRMMLEHQRVQSRLAVSRALIGMGAALMGTPRIAAPVYSPPSFSSTAGPAPSPYIYVAPQWDPSPMFNTGSGHRPIR